MKGYYEGYSYVGFMPDGKKMRFATDTEYREAYAEEARSSLFVYKLHSSELTAIHDRPQHGQGIL